ncbi:hypothetical protein FNV43_RR08762 [Rhamnella rubrinervis]|uniref:Nodulation signaling pathway 2-like protein n=1 Tax=Rhamnella rubrinervis TaxID=2594499 RepID=A0A8K0MJ38_9ROSA|nr:hypothetical protein FNV43_RR08762 [Rhamnella rubrinervis]
MMQPELLQPSWPFYNVISSPLDQVGQSCMDSHVDVFEFPSLFSTIDTCSEISQIPFSSSSSMFSGNDHLVQISVCDEALQVMSPMENFQTSGEIGSIWEESVGSFLSQQVSMEGNDLWSTSSSMKSDTTMDVNSIQTTSITLPGDMEIENAVAVRHLLGACGEAMENKQRELVEVLLRCISDKVSPLGQPLERLAFNFCKEIEDQGNYLKQESFKNFDPAFKAFYQMFPYGRFAHFTANSAILEALPDDAETIHIIDYDLEGVQWAPMVEAAAQRHKKLRLTSMKRDEDEEETEFAPQQWGFEETKRKLLKHAKSFGLQLEVKETRIEELVTEIKKTKKRGGGRDFLVFNCMVELPHMKRVTSRKHVFEFLRVANDLLSNSSNCKSNNVGIIVLGDGDACEKLRNCSSFSPFFDGYLVHYQALLESMESNFPKHLAEARLAMECLFVWPYISSTAWFQKWKEMKEGYHFQAGFGVEERRLSKESLMEAKEMVREEKSYGVKVEGQNGNVMSLEWKGASLVRVSTWTNLS